MKIGRNGSRLKNNWEKSEQRNGEDYKKLPPRPTSTLFEIRVPIAIPTRIGAAVRNCVRITRRALKSCYKKLLVKISRT
jgi:hypothetical protein